MVLRKMKGLSHCLGAPPSPSLTLGREANEEEDGEVATGTSLAHGAFAKLLTLDTEELDTRKRAPEFPELVLYGNREMGAHRLDVIAHTGRGVTVRLMITPQGMQKPSQDLTGDLASMNSCVCLKKKTPQTLKFFGFHNPGHPPPQPQAPLLRFMKAGMVESGGSWESRVHTGHTKK